VSDPHRPVDLEQLQTPCQRDDSGAEETRSTHDPSSAHDQHRFEGWPGGAKRLASPRREGSQGDRRMWQSEQEVVNARARARLGSTLREKYKLERLLGIGGMAAVYGATHRNTKRFAVKVLHPELSLHEDLRTRFLREGYIANSVGHPGAVAVLDDDVTEDGAAFLVMELLDGEPVDSLAQRLGPRLEPTIVLAAAAQALDVLIAAHARKIVHRDIKPENLFLTREGEIKVLDFGVARLRDNSPRTFAGFALGTPAYMAPEQALGRIDEIDGRTDLWALGATMFRLLSGRLVHDTPSGQEAMIRAATATAPSLAEISPDVPEGLCRLVDRALAFSRDNRWPSAEAMREAVNDVYRTLQAEELDPQVLRSVASKIQISFPPEGAGDGCAPTALAPIASPPGAPLLPIASPPNASAQSSDAAYATGLTGSSPRPSGAPAFGGTWKFALVASLCLGVGAVIGLVARRSPPVPLPSYPESLREAAAPSPPPPPVSLESAAPPPMPAPRPSPQLPLPRPHPSASASPRPSPHPSASASAKAGAPYDDFDRQ
jgi:eukaryotic-like serine/threonine-protein kinase